MKSILFLNPCLGGGGAEKVLVNLVNNLDRAKYKISVQTIFDIGVNREYLKDDIEYIPGFSKRLPGNTKIFKLFSPKYLYKKIIKKRYDIVVSYLEGLTARILAGCPYNDSKKVAWMHGEQHNKKNVAYCFRSEKEAEQCYSTFDKIICVAETVKRDFQSLLSVATPCEVLYNTNETGEIVDKAKKPLDNYIFSNDFNLISVGRLISEKGYDRLIKIHRRLLDNGVNNHLYLLGQGELEKELKELACKLDVNKTVHFLGFQKNPYQYVAKADLFVCSSRFEGFSTAVTEALVLGKPVVSTNCSGAYELLGKNEEYGIVTSQDEDDLYNGIYRMLTGEGLLQHYTNKAQERGKYFSKEKTVLAVENMLDTL